MIELQGKWRGYGAMIFRVLDRPEIVTVESFPRGMGQGRIPCGAVVTILLGTEGPRAILSSGDVRFDQATAD